MNTLKVLAMGVIVLMMAGCATKVDLSRYQAVPTLRSANEVAAAHPFIQPRISPNVIIEGRFQSPYDSAMRDYFFIANDKIRIFEVAEGSVYRLRLSLQNIESTRRFHPSTFVRTKKGGYFTDPYWTYGIMSSVTAELSAPDGSRRFYEASERHSFSSRSMFQHDLPTERYLDSLYDTMDSLLRQIANDVAAEGVIVSKRISIDEAGKAVFGINMGYAQGLRSEQKVIVTRALPPQLTPDGREVSNRAVIGTARVSDQISEHGSWIVMDDSDTNTLVDVADTVRARY